MSISKCILIALNNVVARKRNSLFVIIIIFIMSTVLFTILFFDNILLDRLNSITSGGYSQCNVTLSIEPFNNKSDYLLQTLNRLEHIEGVVDLTLMTTQNELNTRNNINFDELNLKNINIEIEDTVYRRDGKKYLDGINYLNFNMLTYYSKFPLISLNELKEYQEDKLSSNSAYKYGNSFKNPKEVVISTNLLNKYNIPEEEWNSLIGRSVSVIYNDLESNTENYLLKNYQICGIIESDFFNISSRSDYNTYFFVSQDITYFVNKNAGITINIDSFDKLQSVKDQIFEELELEAEYSLLAENYINLYEIYKEIDGIMKSIFWIIIIMTLSVSSLLLILEINQKQGYFGMLQALGITSIKMNVIFIVENLVYCFIAFIFTSVANYFMANLLVNKIADWLVIELTFSWNRFIISSYQGMIIILLLISIVVIFITNRFNKKDICIYLK